MKRVLPALLLLPMLAACEGRIPLYSPHRPANEAHQTARLAQDCKGCHDISAIRRHKSGDDCLNCHKLSQGY
jgi:hypothetical protein